jgi:hypothetical protein
MTRAQLEIYCNNGQTILSNYPIFGNLAFWTKFGQFGNANVYNPKDWRDVTANTDLSELGTLTKPWSSFERSCTMNSGVSYKVYFAKIGYTDNPQNYIVDIYRDNEAELFQFTRPDDNDV